jgi:hypothetical protein
MVFTLNDSLIIDGSGNVGIGTMPKSSFDISSTNSALTIPGGTTLQRVNNEGMFRFNTETELYELYRLGSWSSFAMVPTISSVNTQVLKNEDSSLTVTGTSFHSSAQWRFVGASKKQYIPKSATFVSDSSVILVRPDVLPPSDAPYQIQCRQMGKVAYFSPITTGNVPVFVSAAALTVTGGSAITPFEILVNDEVSGGIASVSISSGSLPTGLVGEFSTVGVNGKFTISGTTSTVTLTTTYPITLTATDLGNNTISQNYNIVVEVNGVLDGFLSGQMPAAAYSLRRLLNTYYGPQVRVRRSTDNFEADVYLNLNGSVYSITSTGGGTDWATWISGRTLSVTTWYDQSGQANHMYCNPYPNLEFDSTLKTYYINTNPIVGVLRPMITTSYNGLRVGNGAYSVIASFKLNVTTSNKILLSIGPANSACGGENFHPLAVGGGGKFAGGACGGIGTWSSTSGVTPSIGTYTKLVTTYAGGTNGLESIYVNSVLDKTANLTTNTPTSTANRFGVGWIRDDGASYTMNAKIFNILFYNAIQLSSSQVSVVSALLEPPAPTITSTLPANISQSTVSALYTTSYTFTGTATAGSIVWSITPTTYGNINSSTGALTLTFQQATTASGTFVVTATDANGSVSQSWTYSISYINTNGLTYYIDPLLTTSYSGSGSSIVNLVDNSVSTLNGSYSFVNGNIRLSNTSTDALANVSYIQAPSVVIKTVSIWFYVHGTNNDTTRYLLDMREGGTAGYVYTGSPGSNWSTGKLYKNGGAQQSIDWANIETIGQWQNITLVANTGATDDINFFSRFSDNEGYNVSFGPILIYNREITQSENLENYNAFSKRYI